MTKKRWHLVVANNAGSISAHVRGRPFTPLIGPSGARSMRWCARAASVIEQRSLAYIRDQRVHRSLKNIPLECLFTLIKYLDTRLSMVLPIHRLDKNLNINCTHAYAKCALDSIFHMNGQTTVCKITFYHIIGDASLSHGWVAGE